MTFEELCFPTPTILYARTTLNAINSVVFRNCKVLYHVGFVCNVSLYVSALRNKLHVFCVTDFLTNVIDRTGATRNRVSKLQQFSGR